MYKHESIIIYNCIFSMRFLRNGNVSHLRRTFTNQQANSHGEAKINKCWDFSANSIRTFSTQVTLPNLKKSIY